MPSSMIFVGLVVVWLLILVPAVARHRQEVARPSTAALAGRVLERPRPRREPEVDGMDEVDEARAAAEVADDRDDEPAADHRWERPRYRPGRGGFDPEAAALAADARYTFRQRVVLAMLVAAVVTGVVAAVAVPVMWWVHGAVDAALVGYLGYLRRQVRLEESIRARRAARMAGTRRTSAADDAEYDEWDGDGDDDGDPDLDADLDVGSDDERTDDLGREEPERVRGTGRPLRSSSADDDSARDAVEGDPALPRLQPAPPPPLPDGTALVEADEDDPALHDLRGPARPDYRRAAGE